MATKSKKLGWCTRLWWKFTGRTLVLTTDKHGNHRCKFAPGVTPDSAADFLRAFAADMDASTDRKKRELLAKEAAKSAVPFQPPTDAPAE